MKRLIGMVGSALVISTLVAGSVFAGGSSGGGAYHGNKTGNENKKDGRGCSDDYTAYYWGGAYDLNGDGWVCVKWVDSDTFIVDNMSNSD